MTQTLIELLCTAKASFCFTCLGRAIPGVPQQHVRSAIEAGEPLRVALGLCAMCGDRRTVVSYTGCTFH